jgi:hypothetical protein
MVIILPLARHYGKTKADYIGGKRTWKDLHGSYAITWCQVVIHAEIFNISVYQHLYFVHVVL